MSTKKFVSILFVALFLFVVAVAHVAFADASFYARTAVIVDFDFEEDIVVVKDGAGLLWEFYGIEDYCIGDFVSMLMWDVGTPDTIFDDEIIDVVYAGFTVG